MHQRLGVEYQCGVSLRGRAHRLVVLQRQIAKSSWAAASFGSAVSAFCAQVTALIVEAIRTDPGEAEHRLRVLRIPLQRFVEKTRGIDIVETLVQECAPARAV